MEQQIPQGQHTAGARVLVHKALPLSAAVEPADGPPRARVPHDDDGRPVLERHLAIGRMRLTGARRLADGHLSILRELWIDVGLRDVTRHVQAEALRIGFVPKS